MWPPQSSPVEEQVERKLAFEWKLEEMGLRPVDLVLSIEWGALWSDIEDLFDHRNDLNLVEKKNQALTYIDHAHAHEALEGDPEAQMYTYAMLRASAMLVLGAPSVYRAALAAISVKTRCGSVAELEMAANISAVAACCSRASASSRSSRSFARLSS